MRQQGLEPGQIPLLGGGEKPLGELLALLPRGLEPRAALPDVTPGPARELAHVVLALADDLRDLRIAVVEHVVQEQRGSLLGRQALEQHQHRQRQRVGHLGVLGWIVDAVGEDRLGQPLADVLLTPRARRAQLVDRQPGGDGGEVRARGGDLLAVLDRPMDAQQRLLDDVLGFGDAAEHPVGNRERRRAQLLELVFFSGHVGCAPVSSSASRSGLQPIRQDNRLSCDTPVPIVSRRTVGARANERPALALPPKRQSVVCRR